MDFDYKNEIEDVLDEIGNIPIISLEEFYIVDDAQISKVQLGDEIELVSVSISQHKLPLQFQSSYNSEDCLFNAIQLPSLLSPDFNPHEIIQCEKPICLTCRGEHFHWQCLEGDRIQAWQQQKNKGKYFEPKGQARKKIKSKKPRTRKVNPEKKARRAERARLREIIRLQQEMEDNQEEMNEIEDNLKNPFAEDVQL